MPDRKASRLIALLTVKERKRFACWLAGELTPSLQGVTALWEALLLDKDIAEVWEALFPGKRMPAKPFSHPAFRRLENHLTEHLETFLALESFKKDPVIRDYYLIRELNQRKNPALFQQELNKVQKRLDTGPLADARIQRVKMMLQAEANAFDIRQDKRVISLQPYFHKLPEIWLYERCWHALLLHNELSIRGRSVNFQKMWDQLRLDLNTYFSENNQAPLLRFYLALMDLLDGRELPSSALELVLANASLVNSSDLKDIAIMVSNHLLREARSHKTIQAASDCFSFFCWMIETRLVLFGGVMPGQLFTNIVFTGLQAGQVHATELFFHQWLPSLPKARQEEVGRFLHGLIAFEKGDYKEAARAFREKLALPYQDIFARRSLICIRYIQGERAELEDAIRALRHFIQTNPNLSVTSKDDHQKQVWLLEKLVKAHDDAAWMDILNNIQESEWGIELWILRQVAAERPHLLEKHRLMQKAEGTTKS